MTIMPGGPGFHRIHPGDATANQIIYEVNSAANELMNVDDIEGHAISIGESKGVDVVTGDHFVSKSLSDGIIGGTGTVKGYTKIIDKDGDVRFCTSEAKATSTRSPEGKPIAATWEGTFSFTRGTGKWENIHGGGTAKGKFIGPGIFMIDWEGEYFIKK